MAFLLAACQSTEQNLPAPDPAAASAVSDLSQQRMSADLSPLEQERLLERAIRLQPRNGSLWLQMALLRQQQHNCEQALALAQRALRLRLSGPQQQQARQLQEDCQLKP